MNRIIEFFYALLVRIAALLLIPAILIKAIFTEASYLEYIGIYPRRPFDKDDRRIWFHASSVGEVKIAAFMIGQIRKSDPRREIVLTVITKSGKDTARELLGTQASIHFLPIDLRFFLRGAFEHINPDRIVLTETEIYPNLLKMAAERKVRLCLINGRLSERSFQKYLAIKEYLAPILDRFSFFLMQSEIDRRRIVGMGAKPEKCLVADNLKYAIMQEQLNHIKSEQIRMTLGLDGSEKVLVAGSTRGGEERLVLDQFSRLKEYYPDLKLLLAPRHLDRVNDVKGYLKEYPWQYVLRSQIEANGGVGQRDIILLDTLGELAAIYSIATAAFVGGSLVPKGGQNPLEPIALGIPTCFGPYTDNFAEIVKVVLENNLATQIRDSADLYRFFEEVLKGNQVAPDPKAIFARYARSAECTAKKILEMRV